MAIRLSVKINDPDVEKMLKKLETDYALPTEDKIYLLERTIGWLRASQAVTYNVNRDQCDSIRLCISGSQPVSS